MPTPPIDPKGIDIGDFVPTPMDAQIVVTADDAAATASAPMRLWLATDAWGLSRMVTAAQAAEWLVDRRLSLVIHVPDDDAEQLQRKLLSVLEEVRMVSAESTASGSHEVSDRSDASAAPASASSRVLVAVLDPGPSQVLDEPVSATQARLIRVLDAWLGNLPIITEGSFELVQLPEAERLPDVPESLKGTMFARRASMLIRFAHTGVVSPGSRGSSIESGEDPRNVLDGRRPGERPPSSPSAPR